jgi:hypothetical protein
MRIEGQVFPQSLLESFKSLGKKEIDPDKSEQDSANDDSQPLTLSLFGSSGTYSVNSLKAAVDYHVKFLAVAENNMMAVNHPPTIPREVLDHFNGLETGSFAA